MRIDAAVALYAEYKNANGFDFGRAAKTLLNLSRRTGNGNGTLSEITTRQVSDFLNGPRTGARVYRQNHSVVRRFFDYATAREWMPEFRMPPNRPYERLRFVPYVYSRDEVRRLIRAAREMSPVGLGVLPRTVAGVILTLYATGASVTDVYGLKCEDIDFEKATIKFGPRLISRARKLPIGKDLLSALTRYKRWREMQQIESPYFFPQKNGRRLCISSAIVSRAFKRSRQQAGIVRYDGASFQPRLQDFRATFAVHRISSWIKKEANLSRLLPALSSYMGYIDLVASERYLELTAERFRKQLDRLSPAKGKRRWRDDAKLIGYLSGL